MPGLRALTRCDDRELARRHRAGDRRAREALIVRHLPLARRLALQYRSAAHPLDDLVQVASLGLVKAVDRWEPERGLAFSTFAVPTMLGDLRRYFRDSTWAVRPPRDAQELALSLERVRGPLTAQLGREPTPDDFAERLGRSRDQVAAARQAAEARFAGSLDAPAPVEPDAPESLADRSGEDDGGYDGVEARVALEQLLSGLDRRAAEVVLMRFSDDLLQREIGGRLGISQMHVSRILRASLSRLEAVVRRHGYTPACSPSPAGP